MSLIDYFAIHIVPRMYRGKGALHPAETGRLTDQVSCVREYDVDIFFIRKNETLIAIDAGYKGHPGLLTGCREIGIDPADVKTLFLTHADPDHAGGLDLRQENHFKNADVYLGEIEENYLTNMYHRKRIGPFGLKNSVAIRDGYHLLKDGGWCFFDIFNYDSSMNKASLAALKDRLDLSVIQYVFTSHNGFTNDARGAFRHVEVIPDLKAKGFLFDETAPYDCFDMRG